MSFDSKSKVRFTEAARWEPLIRAILEHLFPDHVIMTNREFIEDEHRARLVDIKLNGDWFAIPKGDPKGDPIPIAVRVNRDDSGNLMARFHRNTFSINPKDDTKLRIALEKMLEIPGADEIFRFFKPIEGYAKHFLNIRVTDIADVRWENILRVYFTPLPLEASPETTITLSPHHMKDEGVAFLKYRDIKNSKAFYAESFPKPEELIPQS
jgi:hypothetical protein